MTKTATRNSTTAAVATNNKIAPKGPMIISSTKDAPTVNIKQKKQTNKNLKKYPKLKQNEAHSARAESTRKGVGKSSKDATQAHQQRP